MAHTVKWEHCTDSFHANHRIERKARPAGRLRLVIEEELALNEPTPEEIAEEEAFWDDLKYVEDAWWDKGDANVFFEDDYERHLTHYFEDPMSAQETDAMLSVFTNRPDCGCGMGAFCQFDDTPRSYLDYDSEDY